VLHEQLLGDVEDPGAGFVLGLDGTQGHGLCSEREPQFKRSFER
jgi:hypothetical protein